MALFTVTIGSTVVEVYGGLVACKSYLEVSSNPSAIAFTTLADDSEKSKRLVDATRFLDRLPWQGTANGAGGTVLKWPRSNVTIYEGSVAIAVDDSTVPVDIVNAAFELAALFVSSPDLASKLDQSSNIASLAAGTAQIAFFAPTSVTNGTATTYPMVIEQLIAKYLGGGGNMAAGSSKGGAWYGASCDGASAFDDCSTFSRKDPF